MTGQAQERNLDDPEEVTRRYRERHTAPVAALNRWVESHAGGMREIPWFDPRDGGTFARILVLLEAPARQAMRPRFVSRDNPGPAQRNLKLFLAQACVAREETVIWNTVPWLPPVDGPPMQLRAGDIRAGIALLDDVLGFLPELRVVVCAGRTARRAEASIRASRPDIQVLSMPHPSPLAVCAGPHVARQIVDTLALARRVAGAWRRTT